MENISGRFSVKGKKIIVTGGARGIGKCVASCLAAEGAEIAILDLSGDLAKEVAHEILTSTGSKCAAFQCDVTNPAQVTATIDTIAKEFGSIDAVFNNAGICLHKAALDLNFDEWYNIINVNLNGVFLVAQAVGRYFVKNNIKGSIVSTASMSATIVNIPQKQASYNASKAAVVHLTKSLAVEWAEYGIRVNCISPGYTFTDMTEKVDIKLRNIWTDTIPFKRMGRPDELAGAVLYFMSDASTYTSGCDLIIDGCFTCV
jgi:sorbose reductase